MIIVYDHPAWVALQNHVTKNLPEYITFFSAVAIAFICTWPKDIPKNAQDWWDWARDTFQTAVPAARSAKDHGPNPPPPQPPAVP